MKHPCQHCKKYWPDCECEEYLRYREYIQMQNRVSDIKQQNKIKEERLRKEEL